MKFYMQTAVTLRNGDGDAVLIERTWHASQNEAASQRAAWGKRKIKREDMTSEEVDVPTDKKGLLAFLNRECS